MYIYIPSPFCPTTGIGKSFFVRGISRRLGNLLRHYFEIKHQLFSQHNITVHQYSCPSLCLLLPSALCPLSHYLPLSFSFSLSPLSLSLSLSLPCLLQFPNGVRPVHEDILLAKMRLGQVGLREERGGERRGEGRREERTRL